MSDFINTDNLLNQVLSLPAQSQLEYLKAQLALINDPFEREKVETLVVLAFTLGQSNTSQNQIVILIHGIRTNAAWQERVAQELSQTSNIKVFPVGYGYFDAIRFWFPFYFRNKPIERVLREIRGIVAANRTAKIAVVAHSFGTYIVSRILAEQPDIIINRLLLCGSIINDEYRWDLLPKIPPSVLNDVGTDDLWPVAAKVSTWGFGSSGTFGFKTYNVQDRFHKLGHSDFFSLNHIRQYWLPYILSGQIVKSSWGAERPPASTAVSVLSIAPVKTLASIIVAAIGYGGFILYRFAFN
ncbi:alpha/beta hydrolase [Ferribacterium limneticum]|uniref:alpha/beta hydrolase n=1 Tax=Ferribacterium limneticum TaxID=76259 RepID=UPI001CFB1337|nr:alpha/beta hydrolase [Ferribacterium limneticum]UCV28410.1 alpha/beta hydrolase [Ferribacterium limneticum]UCV32327.1 alpha/beta hydrolase [Ferribacterium limneticum]